MPVDVKLQGHASRQSNTSKDTDIVFSLSYDNGLKFADITFTSEQFVSMITALHTRGITAQIWDNLNIANAEHEVKTVFIERMPTNYSLKGEELKEAVKAHVALYEVDGWKASLPDVTNPHNFNRQDNTVSVAFHRYVNK